MFDNSSLRTISSELGEYCYQVTQEITNPSKIQINKLIEAIESEPISSACLIVKCTRAIQLLNNKFVYKNNPEIQEFIRSNFSSMDGSLSQFIYQMASALAIGFADAEVRYKTKGRKVTLKGFNVLNPNNITFTINNGLVKEVKYIDSGMQKYIPLWKVVHIVNGSPFLFGTKKVFGYAEAIKAYSLIRLKQLILANMAIASRRFATGIILGLTDTSQTTQQLDVKTGKPIIDQQTGKPILKNNGEILFNSLKSIDNFGLCVTDKNNAITTLNVNAGEQFWTMALNIIDMQLMRCFQIPDTIFNAPTNPFGNGMTSTNQLSILDSSIMNFVVSLKENLIEKVVKPLIIFNFGKQPNDYYGDWDIIDESEQSYKQMQFSNLVQAMSMGLVNNQNQDAQNALMTLLNLPKTNPEEQIAQKTFEAQIQAMQQQAAQTTVQSPDDLSQQPTDKNSQYP
mgnify:CR=1 FL=1